MPASYVCAQGLTTHRVAGDAGNAIRQEVHGRAPLDRGRRMDEVSQFAELQAALLAAGYREERVPRRPGQRVYGAGHLTVAAQLADCERCGHHGLRVYPFYRASPFAVAVVIACPACGWAEERPEQELR